MRIYSNVMAGEAQSSGYTTRSPGPDTLMLKCRTSRALIYLLPLLWLAAGRAGPAPLSPSRASQQPQAESTSEVVANLAAGRVAVLVCRDGVVVATAESRVEPDTLPPVIVPVSAFRVAVLLGPVEWIWPGSGRTPLRLDAALRQAGQTAALFKPHNVENTATDIETLGLAFLEPLRNAAGEIHSPLHMERKELFTEVLLAGYIPEYGAEIWSLRYRVEQHILRGDFYQTVVHRPEYIQLYPPEKGQPRVLVETHYPPEDATEPTLMEQLRSGEIRLAALRRADERLGRVADLLEKGEGQKVWFVDGLEFLRAAMQAVSPQGRRQMIATVRQDKGVEWVVGEQMSAPAIPGEKREPAAPTLYKHPKPPQ